MKIEAGTVIGNGSHRVAIFPETIDLASYRLILLRGANGTGKTTLLKTLQGLVHFTGDRRLPSLPVGSIYLPERLDWSDDLSFFEALRELCSPSLRSIFSTLAASLLLPEKSPYGILSKGNRQKMSVILTEAIAQEQGLEWLLLDEPLSGLDSEAQESLLAFWHQYPLLHRLISSHGDASRFNAGLTLQFEKGEIISKSKHAEERSTKQDC